MTTTYLEIPNPRSSPARFLCVSSTYPRPTTVGVDVRVLWLLRALSALPDVSLTFISTGGDVAREDGLALAKELGMEVEVVSPPGSHPNAIARWVRAAASRRPVWVRDLYSKELQARVVDHERQAEVVFYLDDAASQYALGRRVLIPSVFDKHMVMLWMTRQNPSRGRPRLLFHSRAIVHLALTSSWERATLRKASRITVTSEEDRSRLYSTHRLQAAAVLPSGTEPTSHAWQGGGKKVVGFLGALDIAPNDEGLGRFLDAGLQQLHDHHVTLAVAGRAAGRRARSGEMESVVEFLGFVEHLTTWFDSLGVFVVPIWSGSGVKTKTVTAMAAGVPIVSTRAGLEGIPAVDGLHALVREDPLELAKAAIYLIERPDIAKRIGSAGRNLLRDAFSLPSVTTEYEKLLGSNLL